MVDFNLDAFDIQKKRTDLSTPSQVILDSRERTRKAIDKHNMFTRGFALFTGTSPGARVEYPTYGTSSASQQKAQNQSVMTDFYRALDTIAAQYEEEHGKRLTEDQQWAIMKQFNLGPQGMEDAKKYMAAWGVSSKEQRARNTEERAVASAERAIAKDDLALLKEYRDNLSNAKVADLVINILEEYRPLLQGTPLGTAGNRISEAVAKVHKLGGYTDREKLEVLKEVIPRLRSISQFTAEEDKQVRDLEKSVTDAATAKTQVEQAAETQERAREDQEWQRLDREKKSLADTKALGRNITANKLYNEMIDLLADGEPWDKAYATITQKANKNISDRGVISSLETSLKGLKPEDKRTTESKKFDERMALLRVGKKSVQQQIFDVDKVIQMEIDSVDDNPYFYSYSAPKKEAQAIEQAFHNLMLADPSRINQEAFRDAFIEFSKGEPTLAQSEEALKNASKVYKLPVRVLLYIIYGRKGYEELIEQDYAEYAE